ncbi:MAG: rhomboid family intramembrane serine protease [Chitinophagales bacterium]|nr:rhomboid family intramembrane serine protease [Chitinophagales bacterium]
MFRSISQDIRSAFNYGNMVVKLLIINISVFVVTALIGAFAPGFYHTSILPYLALPGDVSTLMYRPWTLLTHMFLHQGVWHLAGNMIILYWMGNIAGDLLGDRKILPVYILGGLVGAIFYLISYQLMPSIGSYALGASAAALAVTFMAVAIAPDFVHLILVGAVKIKYIGLPSFFLTLLVVLSANAGGHLAHLGGTLFGLLFVGLLRNGTDLSAIFYKKDTSSRRKNPNLRIAHKSENNKKAQSQTKTSDSISEVDRILEKIKRQGYESLTDEEKEVLYKASKS